MLKEITIFDTIHPIRNQKFNPMDIDITGGRIVKNFLKNSNATWPTPNSKSIHSLLHFDWELKWNRISIWGPEASSFDTFSFYFLGFTCLFGMRTMCKYQILKCNKNYDWFNCYRTIFRQFRQPDDWLDLQMIASFVNEFKEIFTAQALLGQLKAMSHELGILCMDRA